MADNDDRKNQEGEGEEGAAPKSGLAAKLSGLAQKINVPLLLTVVFALVNLAIIGGAAYWIYWIKMVYERPKLTEERLEQRYVQEQIDVLEQGQVTVPLGEFKVNLKGGEKGKSSILFVDMNLEIYKKEYKAEVVHDLPKLRDGVIQILAAKVPDQLRTLQGKLFLKDELLNQMNRMVKNGVVKNIYFTSFLIQ